MAKGKPSRPSRPASAPSKKKEVAKKTSTKPKAQPGKKPRGSKPNRGLGSGLSKLLGDDLGEALEAVQAPVATPARTQVETSSPNKKGGAGEGEGEGGEGRVMMVPVGRIYASSQQPRRDFSEAELEELAQSFRHTGILQPILVVRQQGEDGEGGEYRIVAGERRWRAAQRAGLHELPVIVKSLTEEQILQVALIENIQRQDLNIVEEALAYRRLADDFGHRQEDIAEIVGKSRSYIANVLRLLSLPEGVLGHLRRGELGLGHVRGLVNRGDAEHLAERMVREGLNVRQAENLCRAAEGRVGGDSVGEGGVGGDSASMVGVERELAEIFGVGVKLKRRGNGYVISLGFGDVGDLNDFIRAWRGKNA